MQPPVNQAQKQRLVDVPDAWVRHVDAVSQRMFGGADLQGAALAKAVAEVSRVYTLDRTELTKARVRTADLIARLKWFLHRDLAKVELPLTELSLCNALPVQASWRVLDVGAGLGTSTLGVARVARRFRVERVEVRAFDRDGEALRVFNELAKDVTTLDAAPISLATTTCDVARVVSQVNTERFELIVVGFVINELWPELDAEQRVERASQWLRELSRLLTDDGALIVLEPALREQTRQLQRVRDALESTAEQRPFVFGPCVRSGPCPMLSRERDWCHAQVPFQLPKALSDVARAAGLRDHDLTFSYLTLRNQPGRLGVQSVDESLQRVVSSQLPSKGKVELMVCGEAGLSRAVRLNRHRSEHNAAFDDLARGAVTRLPVAGENGRVVVGESESVDVVWHWADSL